MTPKTKKKMLSDLYVAYDDYIKDLYAPEETISLDALGRYRKRVYDIGEKYNLTFEQLKTYAKIAMRQWHEFNTI